MAVLSLVEHPRVDMPAEKVEELFNTVADIAEAKLTNPDRAFTAKNSLIDLAREIMDETSWKRADVETALRRAYGRLGIAADVDSFEMRIREP